jgi:DNA polymerase-1
LPSAPLNLYVDGHNLLHRAAFGFPARITARSGRDITLVFGFFALIRAATRKLPDPPHVVVVFDGENGAADRRAVLPAYKPPVAGDETVFADLPRIRDGLGLCHIPCIEHDDHEADDVIATLATRHPDSHHLIMSTDKDFYQLLGGHIGVLNTSRRADQRHIQAHDVLTRYGVTPGQWCDYRALTGDPSDNIPGIRGIGERTATRLLDGGARLEDLEGLGRLTGRAGTAITGRWDDLLTWRHLIQLRGDLPLSPLPGRQQATDMPPAPEIVGQLGLWA